MAGAASVGSGSDHGLSRSMKDVSDSLMGAGMGRAVVADG